MPESSNVMYPMSDEDYLEFGRFKIKSKSTHHYGAECSQLVIQISSLTDAASLKCDLYNSRTVYNYSLYYSDQLGHLQAFLPE